MEALRELKVGATTMAMRSLVRGLALAGDPVAAVLGFRSLADPYPKYERIRARGDLWRHPLGPRPATGHATVNTLLRDSQFGVEPAAAHGGIDWRPSRDGEHLSHPTEESILLMNPPEHTRLRRLVAPCFTPAALRAMEPRVERVVQDCLRRLAGRDRLDLVGDFAAHIPVEVVRQLFDLPHVADADLRRWGSVLIGTIDGVRTLAERQAVRRTTAEMTALLGDLLDRRRHGNGDDVISTLARSDVDGETAAVRDLVALTGLVLIAGFETTINAIASGVWHLLSSPPVRQALADDPDLAAPATDETLRLDPPIQLTLRTVREPCRVAEVDLRPGDLVMPIIAAANRDPTVFDDPDRYDPFRPNPGDHLTFSAGIHYCVGAVLARMEIRMALAALAREPLDLAGPVRFKPTRNIRGPRSLPVRRG